MKQGVLWLYLALLLVSSVAQAGKKVAVIFNGGDARADGPMTKAFLQTQIEAQQLYKSSGYDEIIVLTSSEIDESKKPTAQNLSRILENMRDVSELDVNFIAHGQAQPQIKSEGSSIGYGMGGMSYPDKLPIFTNEADYGTYDFNAFSGQLEKYKKRGGSFPITPTESKLFSESQKSTGVYEESQFWIATIENNNDYSNPNDVGLGDLKNAIQKAKTNNPEMTTTVIANPCYSGGLARGLAEVDKTQVFAASQAVIYSYSFDGKNNKVLSSYERYYYKYLNEGLTYQKAHDLALNEYFEYLKSQYEENEYLNDDIMASYPRSGFQEYIMNWCIQHKDLSLDKVQDGHCQKEDILLPVQKTNNILFNFYKHSSVAKNCQMNILQTKVNEAKKKLLTKIFKTIEENYKKEPDYKVVYQKLMDDLKQQIEKTSPAEANSIEFLKKQLKDMESKNDKDREIYVKMARESGLSLNQLFLDACVYGKTTSYPVNCNSEIMGRYYIIPAMSAWGEFDRQELKDQPKKVNSECKTTRKEGSPETRTSNYFNCIQKQKDVNPVLTYGFLEGIQYGSACEQIKLAQKAIDEDIACTEKFKLYGNCQEFARAREIGQLGLKSVKSTSKSSEESSEGRAQ